MCIVKYSELHRVRAVFLFGILSIEFDQLRRKQRKALKK